jgi:hypothetical protein
LNFAIAFPRRDDRSRCVDRWLGLVLDELIVGAVPHPVKGLKKLLLEILVEDRWTRVIRR